MKKILSLATAALLGLTGVVHAATLDVTLGPSLFFAAGGAPLNPNIDLATYPSLVLNNATIVTPPVSVLNQYTAPNGGIGLFGNSFLAVFGVNQSQPSGSAIFTTLPTENVFSFTWGSIDVYNTLILKDSNNTIFTITGTDILNHLAGSIPGTTESDVRFFDPFGTIVTAELDSSVNSFEAANFGQSATPLPGTLVLFSTALLGMAFFMRQCQRKAI